jgi:GNAT superfamily N-acetyltransferase
MSDATSSKAFQRWFGDSVVVDAAGRPKVVYHGATSGGFTVFQPGAASYIEGHGESFLAGQHYGDPTPPVDMPERDVKWHPGVYAAYLRIERPLLIDAEGRNYDDLEDLSFEVFGRNIEELADKAQRLGYDGVIVENVYDIGPHDPVEELGTTYVVFTPHQVKSATYNTGAYDPYDADIRANVSSSRGQSRALDSRRNGGSMQPTPWTIRPAERADYVLDFFDDCGITPSDYETPFEVCVSPHGHVVGVSTFGYRPFSDGYSEASFSVAVDADARRAGVARALVQSIIDQHPGVELVPWVVSPGMAMLLERMGFDSDSRHGWSQDEPYMRLTTPARQNPSIDSWISAEALRLSRPHSLEQRERVLQDQALMTGPVSARPPAAVVRTRPEVDGDWPYGTLDEIIARVVAEAVNVHFGNVRAASRTLGISHTTTMRWLRTYEAMTPNALPIVREPTTAATPRKPTAKRVSGPSMSQGEPTWNRPTEPAVAPGRPRTLRAPTSGSRGPNMAALRQDVLEADSGPDLVRALDTLRVQSGSVPDNLYLVLRYLEHPDNVVLLEALGRVEHAVAAKSVPASMRRGLITRLDGIVVSSFDPRVQSRAERLVAALRA